MIIRLSQIKELISLKLVYQLRQPFPEQNHHIKSFTKNKNNDLENLMGILSNSSYRTIFVIFALYSMCNIIEIVEGRFLWDLSSYCINYCSRVNGQMPPIGVCSCHRITSYHRRMSLNDLQTASKKDFHYQQTMENFNQ